MRLPSLHRANGTGNIAVPFTRRPAAGELDALARQGADIFELRIDLAECSTPEQVRKTAESFAGFPLIATARSVAEGGRAAGDQLRRELLAACADHASAIDIELASPGLHNDIAAMAAGRACDMIVSSHHLDATPDSEKLAELAEAAFAVGADVFKIACMVSNEGDVQRLAELVASGRENGRKIAAMGMGDSDLARESRATLGRAGSFFVFARAADATAAGQPGIEWLARRLAD